MFFTVPIDTRNQSDTLSKDSKGQIFSDTRHWPWVFWLKNVRSNGSHENTNHGFTKYSWYRTDGSQKGAIRAVKDCHTALGNKTLSENVYFNKQFVVVSLTKCLGYITSLVTYSWPNLLTLSRATSASPNFNPKSRRSLRYIWRLQWAFHSWLQGTSCRSLRRAPQPGDHRWTDHQPLAAIPQRHSAGPSCRCNHHWGHNLSWNVTQKVIWLKISYHYIDCLQPYIFSYFH